MSKTSKAIRLAYYICHDGRLQWRLSDTLHRAFLAGVRNAPAFANTRQCILEIQYDDFKRSHVRGMFYVFDEDGRLDISEAAEAIDIALNEKPTHSQAGVVDIEPVLRGKRWRHRHLWSPPPELVDAVETDLQIRKAGTSRGKVPILK